MGGRHTEPIEKLSWGSLPKPQLIRLEVTEYRSDGHQKDADKAEYGFRVQWSVIPKQFKNVQNPTQSHRAPKADDKDAY